MDEHPLLQANEKVAFMDSVGNSQLDLPDVESIFPLDKYDPGTIDYYLRNVTHYLLDSGGQIKTGVAIDGPCESNLSWTTESLEDALLSPPRPVLRLYP